MQSKRYCHGCDQKRKITKDHIIPQAIGGKLKTSLCISCRDKTHPIDTKLVKSFHQIATILNVKRERRQHQPFRVTVLDTGEEFDVDSEKGYRAHPKVNIEHEENGSPIPDIRARSEKELRQILEGIQAKHGQFSQPVEITKTNDESILGLVEYENTVGGRLFMRSVAKTAFLYLTTRLPKEKYSSSVFDAIREFIFEDKGQLLSSFNFVHTKFMKSRSPLHGIAVHFDSNQRNIVGYVQYFGIFRFSVLLATNVPWSIVIPDLKYFLNPVTGRVFSKKSEMSVLPDITNKECLSPLQTTKFVYLEILDGYKRIDKYCDVVSDTSIEFPDNPNM